MRLSTRVGILLLAGSLGMIASSPQQGAPPGGYPVGRNQTGGAQVPSSITATLDFQLSIEEREVIGLADAMPEDKYSFAPTNGEFKGVRTFGQQLKHVAAANFIYASSILGEKPPVDVGEDEDGPASLKGKDEIIQYLKRSFAYVQKAVATISANNVVTPFKNPFGDGQATRLSMVTFIIGHCDDHYGQLDLYLRMNGIEAAAGRR